MLVDTSEDRRFAKILVKLGLVSEEAVAESIAAQDEASLRGEELRIGRILCEKGHLDQNALLEKILEVQRVLKLFREEKASDESAPSMYVIPKIGRILIQNELVSDKKIQQALAIQDACREQGIVVRLGDVLIEKGWIDRATLEGAFAIQKRIRETHAIRRSDILAAAVLGVDDPAPAVDTTEALQVTGGASATAPSGDLGPVPSLPGATDDDKVFAEMVHSLGLVGRLQLEDAFAIQSVYARNRIRKPLHDVLAELHYLTPEQIEPVLARLSEKGYRVRRTEKTAEATARAIEAAGPRLGELAVEVGLVPPGAVHDCLAIQKELARKGVRRPIGELFVAKKYLTEKDLQGLLAVQTRRRRKAQALAGGGRKSSRLGIAAALVLVASSVAGFFTPQLWREDEAARALPPSVISADRVEPVGGASDRTQAAASGDWKQALAERHRSEPRDPSERKVARGVEGENTPPVNPQRVPPRGAAPRAAELPPDFAAPVALGPSTGWWLEPGNASYACVLAGEWPDGTVVVGELISPLLPAGPIAIAEGTVGKGEAQLHFGPWLRPPFPAAYSLVVRHGRGGALLATIPAPAGDDAGSRAAIEDQAAIAGSLFETVRELAGRIRETPLDRPFPEEIRTLQAKASELRSGAEAWEFAPFRETRNLLGSSTDVLVGIDRRLEGGAADGVPKPEDIVIFERMLAIERVQTAANPASALEAEALHAERALERPAAAQENFVPDPAHLDALIPVLHEHVARFVGQERGLASGKDSGFESRVRKIHELADAALLAERDLARLDGGRVASHFVLAAVRDLVTRIGKIESGAEAPSAFARVVTIYGLGPVRRQWLAGDLARGRALALELGELARRSAGKRDFRFSDWSQAAGGDWDRRRQEWNVTLDFHLSLPALPGVEEESEGEADLSEFARGLAQARDEFLNKLLLGEAIGESAIPANLEQILGRLRSSFPDSNDVPNRGSR